LSLKPFGHQLPIHSSQSKPHMLKQLKKSPQSTKQSQSKLLQLIGVQLQIPMSPPLLLKSFQFQLAFQLLTLLLPFTQLKHTGMQAFQKKFPQLSLTQKQLLKFQHMSSHLQFLNQFQLPQFQSHHQSAKQQSQSPPSHTNGAQV
jgi:hypothetical protein